MLTRTRNTNELQRFTPFSLIEWESPWRAFGSLKQDLDRLFGAYERSVAEPYSDTQDAGAIRDTGNELRLEIDLPGVSKKDVELSVSGDNLFVRASRTQTTPEGYTPHRRERAAYKFEHTWRLPVPVDTEKVEAKLAEGVLTVKLPKSPNAQPKQITVKAE